MNLAQKIMIWQHFCTHNIPSAHTFTFNHQKLHYILIISCSLPPMWTYHIMLESPKRQRKRKNNNEGFNNLHIISLFV